MEFDHIFVGLKWFVIKKMFKTKKLIIRYNLNQNKFFSDCNYYSLILNDINSLLFMEINGVFLTKICDYLKFIDFISRNCL